MKTNSGRGGKAASNKSATKSAGSRPAAASKGAASKSTAAKSTASKGTAAKSASSKGPASKSASKGVAVKSSASKSANTKAAPAKASKAPVKGAPGKGVPPSKTTVKGVVAKKAAPKAVVAPKKAAPAFPQATKKNVPAKSAGMGRGSATPGRGAVTAAPKPTQAPVKAKRKSISFENDLDKIFRDLLKDIYWAEKALTKGLRKMSKSASNPKLKDAFTTHLGQTEEQIAKLERAFGLLGMKAQGKKCAAMEGLLEEGDEHIEEYEKGPGLDAALIVGAQKVEHYEIASYGSLRTFARTLGQEECARIFEEIREQEADTDELLTQIAQSLINVKAAASHEEEGTQSSGTGSAGTKAQSGGGAPGNGQAASEQAGDMAAEQEGGSGAEGAESQN